jgi:hypothetical protein
MGDAPLFGLGRRPKSPWKDRRGRDRARRRGDRFLGARSGLGRGTRRAASIAGAARHRCCRRFRGRQSGSHGVRKQRFRGASGTSRVQAFAAHRRNSAIVYVGTADSGFTNGVFKSTNGGRSWRAVFLEILAVWAFLPRRRTSRSREWRSTGSGTEDHRALGARRYGDASSTDRRSPITRYGEHSRSRLATSKPESGAIGELRF